MKTTERSTPVSAAMRKRADRSSKLSLAVLDDVPDSPQRSADPVRRSHLWFIAIVECAGPLYRLFLRPIFTPLESVSPAHLAVENEEDMEWHAELKNPEEEREERLIELCPPELNELWHFALMISEQTLCKRPWIVKLLERVIVYDEGAKCRREGLLRHLHWRR